jgi:hypothetical protein
MGKNNLENILKTEGIKNEQPIKSRYYKIAEGLELFSYGSGLTGLITLPLMPKLPVYAISWSAAALAYVSAIALSNYKNPENNNLKENNEV